MDSIITPTDQMASRRRQRASAGSTAGLLLLGLGLSSSCISTAQAFLLPASAAASQARAMVCAAAGASGGEPIKVTPEMIKHTATLAQLNFDDAEIAALVPRFQAFLGFVDKMREVPDDAPGMAPGSLPPVEEVLRADAPAVFGNQDGIFANMARQEDAYLVVPKVGEEEA